MLSLFFICGAGSSLDCGGFFLDAAGRPLPIKAAREFLKSSGSFLASAAFFSSYVFDSGFWTDVFGPPAAGPGFAGVGRAGASTF